MSAILPTKQTVARNFRRRDYLRRLKERSDAAEAAMRRLFQELREEKKL